MQSKLIRLQGNISDMLDSELFLGATKAGPTVELVGANFFSDFKDQLEPECDFDNCLYYQNKIYILRMFRQAWTPGRPYLGLEEVINNQDKQVLEKLAKPRLNLPVKLKLYSDEELFLLNKTVEVVGYLSFAQEYSPIVAGLDIIEEQKVQFLNPFFVPSIHVVAARRVNMVEELSKVNTKKFDVRGSLQKMKEGLVNSCQGDDVVANCLLYNILSSVSLRPYGTPIDNISLNVYNLKDADLTNSILKALKLFCPWPTIKPITLEALAKGRLYGVKDYDTNCIVYDSEELFEGSQLILDETSIEIGSLTEVAIKNVQFITSLIQNQKFVYDFQFYNFETEANCMVTSLSQSRSIFEFEFRVTIL